MIMTEAIILPRMKRRGGRRQPLVVVLGGELLIFQLAVAPVPGAANQ
jgi:hypothetical protein